MWTSGHFTNQLIGCTGAICPLEVGDFVSQPRLTTGGKRASTGTPLPAMGSMGCVAENHAALYLDVIVDGSRLPQLVFFPPMPRKGDESRA